MITHFHYVVQTVTHFLTSFCMEFYYFCVNVTQVLCKCISIVSKGTLSRNGSPFLCVTVTQGTWNVFPSIPSRHSTLLLPFESLLTHSPNYVMWTATYFFRLLFTHCSRGTVPFFLCNCYTRSLSSFSIVLKWTIHFIISFWVIVDSSIMLCGLLHIFSVYFSLIFSVELFRFSYVTVTQGL